ncbi:hypothetical protein D0T56_01315, partial [Dysgonomonas sp. 520]|nr:hypothetical protein [Dysgonomonas sp. 520]
STISSQKSYNIGSYTNNASSQHTYINGEENVFGSLFQWGRIADGHENRNPALNNMAYTGMTTAEITSGSRCSTSDTQRPYSQISTTSTWYGKFIYNAPDPYNWNPAGQSTVDQLWRTSHFIQNDPCAHYKVNGTYQAFWHTGTDGLNNGDAACSDAGTAWRLPFQDEWGSIYKGGAISGSPETATANTWSWYGGTATLITSIRGYEIKPDGYTTTLFLPANGHRNSGNGLLYDQGTSGFYWSSSINSTSASNLDFNNGSIIPASSHGRADGFAVRCVKNE